MPAGSPVVLYPVVFVVDVVVAVVAHWELLFNPYTPAHEGMGTNPLHEHTAPFSGPDLRVRGTDDGRKTVSCQTSQTLY